MRVRVGRAGFSILEVVISMGIVAIAITGTLGVLLAVHQHNTASTEASLAYRACQEVLELMLAMPIDDMIDQHGVPFAATKIHPTEQIGIVEVLDVSPPGWTNSLFEVSKDTLDEIISRYVSVKRVLLKFYKQRLLTNLLYTSPIFRPLTPEQRKDLIEKFKSREVPEQTTLLEQGGKGDGLYLLLSGQVRVTKDSKLLAKLEEGDVFGEMSLLTNEPVSADVVTTKMVLERFVVDLGQDGVATLAELLAAQGGHVGWHEREAIPLPPQIEEALKSGGSLQLRYLSAVGEETRRMVTPLRVTAHAGNTYLVAMCHLRDEERTFRLDRIVEMG